MGNVEPLMIFTATDPSAISRKEKQRGSRQTHTRKRGWAGERLNYRSKKEELRMCRTRDEQLAIPPILPLQIRERVEHNVRTQ